MERDMKKTILSLFLLIFATSSFAQVAESIEGKLITALQERHRIRVYNPDEADPDWYIDGWEQNTCVDAYIAKSAKRSKLKRKALVLSGVAIVVGTALSNPNTLIAIAGIGTGVGIANSAHSTMHNHTFSKTWDAIIAAHERNFPTDILVYKMAKKLNKKIVYIGDNIKHKDKGFSLEDFSIFMEIIRDGWKKGDFCYTTKNGKVKPFNFNQLANYIADKYLEIKNEEMLVNNELAYVVDSEEATKETSVEVSTEQVTTSSINE